MCVRPERKGGKNPTQFDRLFWCGFQLHSRSLTSLNLVFHRKSAKKDSESANASLACFRGSGMAGRGVGHGRG